MTAYLEGPWHPAVERIRAAMQARINVDNSFDELRNAIKRELEAAFRFGQEHGRDYPRREDMGR